MSKQKKAKTSNKRSNKKTWIWIIAIAIIFLLGEIIIEVFLKDSPRILQGMGNKNTIELYIDKEPHNPDNLDKIHFADVYVKNGSIDVTLLERGENLYIDILRKDLKEIEKKETLPLMFEPELGLIQVMEVPKNNSDYIYAVDEYLSRSFETKVIYSVPPQDGRRLSEIECMDVYDEIDTELQNANYCGNDSDCRTLPLAGPYIEFGCYHYINKNENSSYFYNKMNDYLADCERVIDLCRESPNPKCESGICVAVREEIE
ncbi:MAG: hypothetical protein V1660_02105 [archaeon]